MDYRLRSRLDHRRLRIRSSGISRHFLLATRATTQSYSGDEKQ